MEYISERPGTRLLRNFGHVQPGVPPDRSAVPKSPIFIKTLRLPSSYLSLLIVYKIFSGFRSLWQMPDVQSWTRPSSSCLQISIDCVSVNFFLLLFRFPSHNSVMKTSKFLTFPGKTSSKVASFLLSSKWRCCLEVVYREHLFTKSVVPVVSVEWQNGWAFWFLK